MQSNVINTTHKVYYAQRFVDEVEMVLNENIRDRRGTSERVTQVGLWIANLLLFIQSIGNLDGTYTINSDCLSFDTTIYDNGIGVFFFTVYFDNETEEHIVRILDVNWDFNTNRLYNLMFESKPIERLKQLIRECVGDVLRNQRLAINFHNDN